MAAGLLGCASPLHADEWTGVYIGIGGGMGAANHDLSLENGPAILRSPRLPRNFLGWGATADFSRWASGSTIR